MSIHIPFWNSVPNKQFVIQARAAIPQHTPDICVLEQQENHVILNYGDGPKHGEAVGEAFTQERLSMWQQNHVEGTPPVVLKVWGDVIRHVPRAKIKGELYLVPTNDLVYIDKHRQNGVLCQRKEVQVIVPEFSYGGFPVTARAWMYYGRKEHWADKINWDFSFYRGKGGSFSIAPTYRDDRRWIGEYFKHCWEEAKDTTKCFLHCHKGLSDPPITITPITPTKKEPSVGIINGATVLIRSHE